MIQFSDPTGMSEDQIYEQYAPALYGYILSKVPNKDQAAEILRRSFVYATRHMAWYNPQQLRFFSWLVRIVHEELRSVQAIAIVPITVAIGVAIS